MAKVIKEINEIEKNSELIICSKEKIEELYYNYKTIFEVNCINNLGAVDKLIAKIQELKIKKIVFAHYNYIYKEIIEKLKLKNKKIEVEFIWFGSHCLFSNEGEQYYLNQMLDLYNMDLVDKIHFTNKSMYEFYKKEGYKVEKFKFEIKDLEFSKQKNENKKENKIKIGLYFNKDNWETNMYNQLSACAMIENAEIKVYPDTKAIRNFCKLMKIKVINKENFDISKRENLLQDMSENDVNLHVSFTNVETIKILESIKLGIPCITGNNHNIKDKNCIIVKAEDNVDEIVCRINEVLKFKN